VKERKEIEEEIADREITVSSQKKEKEKKDSRQHRVKQYQAYIIC